MKKRMKKAVSVIATMLMENRSRINILRQDMTDMQRVLLEVSHEVGEVAYKQDILSSNGKQDVPVTKESFSQLKNLNGQDVSKLIRDNPTLTNTQIGDLLGVSHQMITAWKLYHDDWKEEDND